MKTLSGQNSFNRDVLKFVLWMIPTVYLAIIASVTAHEVIGHGVVAALLGGKFNGFGIRVDGMGWASLDIISLAPIRQAIVLAAGAVVTTTLSVLFFILGYRFRKHFITSATLFVFAFAFLCDGIPYFFWDSIYQGTIGDPSGILRLYPSEGMRMTWIIVSGIVWIAGIWGFNHLMLTHALRFLKSSIHSTRKEIAVTASVLFGIQVLAWLSFDWAQLVPVTSIGILPYVAPIGLTTLFLATEVFREVRRAKNAGIPIGSEASEDKVAISWRTPIIVSCLITLAVTVVIIGWLQNGVLFR